MAEVTDATAADAAAPSRKIAMRLRITETPMRSGTSSRARSLGPSRWNFLPDELTNGMCRSARRRITQ